MADNAGIRGGRSPVSIGRSTKLVPYGESCYRADKLFFSPVKEDKWLNFVALKGYALVGRTFRGYIFEVYKSAYRYEYSVCPLPGNAGTEVAESYIEKRAERASYPVCAFSNKAYYKYPSGKPDAEIARDAAAKRRRLGRCFLFNLGLLLFFLGLLCYNLAYFVRFDAADVAADKTSAFWKFAGGLSRVFGSCPTTPYIAVFLVLTLLAIPFTVYFLDQYFYSAGCEKAVRDACRKR